jgi:hypothetical protein
MMLEKLLGGAWVAVGSVITAVAGRHAVDQIAGAAHQWAAHIEAYIHWIQ